MPAHSSHLLQPLDVVCFSPLKLKYSQRVRGLASRHVFHINKEGFLPAFRDAFLDVFTYENCKKAFQATGLVPIDAQVVLDRLDVQLRTPPPLPLLETPWQSQTPSNSYEFGSQARLVSDAIVQSPEEARGGFSQLVKGAERMLHQNVVQAARIHELEEQLAEVTKRKTRKRKQIQHGGTVEYGEAALSIAGSAAAACTVPKRARGSSGQERAQPGQRHCGNCGKTGHNARTCQEDAEEDSKSSASVFYTGSVDSSR